jgi:hypothetical protein
MSLRGASSTCRSVTRSRCDEGVCAVRYRHHLGSPRRLPCRLHPFARGAACATRLLDEGLGATMVWVGGADGRRVALILSPPAKVLLARRSRRVERFGAALLVAQRTGVRVARAIPRPAQNGRGDVMGMPRRLRRPAVCDGAKQLDQAGIAAAELEHHGEARARRSRGGGERGGVVRRRGVRLNRGKRPPTPRRARGRDVRAPHGCRGRARPRAARR